MIPKISRGSDPAGLVKYLFGKGRHNEHANQHLVASSDDLLDSFGFDGHPDESYAKIGERFDRRYRVRERKGDPFPRDRRGRLNPGTVPCPSRPARASSRTGNGKRSSATIWNAWASWTATPRQA